MSHDHNSHAHDHHEESHVASYGVQVLVFFILVAMTGLMVGLTQLHLSSSLVNFIVLTIAIVKAILIIAYLMHLKYEPKVFWVLGSVAVFTLAVIFGFTFFDYGFRESLFK